MAITPNRRAILDLGITEKLRTAEGFHLRRDAKDVGRGRLPGADPITGCRRAGQGDAWILREKYSELAQLQKTTIEADVLTAADVNLAAGVVARNTFRRDDDLTGLSTDAEVIAEGITGFRKRVAAAWDAASLSLGGLTQPDPDADTTQTVPLDRIIEGKVSYPENTPFMLMLQLPEKTRIGNDLVFNFYFGGAASVLPADQHGGHFCLSLRGSGEAILREKTETPGDDPEVDPPVMGWHDVYRLRLGPEALGGNVVLLITPYGKDRVDFRMLSTLLAGGGFTLGGFLATLAGLAVRSNQYFKQGVPEALYIDRKERTGHTHQRTASGAGNIALDHRRKPKADVVIARGRYPTSGVLVDGPFQVPDYPAGTPLKLRVDSYTIPNSAVIADLRDATTHAALDTNDDGDFLTNAGQTNYYARIVLNSPDGIQTPVIWGYNVDADPIYTLVERTPTRTSLWGLDVQGADLSPDHEGCTVKVRDLQNVITKLRAEDDVRSRVSVVSASDGSLIGHLFEGVTLRPQATVTGRAGIQLADAGWRDYENARLAGVWTRFQRQYARGILDFRLDPNAPVNPGTLELIPLPWKVTDIIRKVLFEGGVPEDEIDVPDLPFRLWESESLSTDDYMLQFGTDYARLAVKLARDYLGRILLRDPNAGTHGRGMWRLIANPQAPYTNFLATLHTFRPVESVGKVVTQLGALGSTSAMELDMGGRPTYREWTVAPDVNDVRVFGIGETTDGSGLLVSKPLRNYADVAKRGVLPSSLGPEPSLTSQAAVDWVARARYQRGAQEQRWWEGIWPLIMLRDPLDDHQHPDLLRPLRVNDLVMVDSYAAVVRNCNPMVPQSDRMQMMYVQGLFL